MNKFLYLLIATFFATLAGQAQDSRQAVAGYLSENREALGLTAADLNTWKIDSEYETRHNGVRHLHISQHLNGIPVFNAVSALAQLPDGRMLLTGNRLLPDLTGKVNTARFSLNGETALARAAQALSLGEGDIAESSFEPVYYPMEDGSVRLAWNTVLHTADRQHVWNVFIDGVTGVELFRWDQVLHCSFGETGFSQPHQHRHAAGDGHDDGAHHRDGNLYNVYAWPVESPSHGDRSIAVNPADPEASPFGWHDQNGQEGAEHTITRGNNVWAYEDADGNNNIGYSPSGGAELIFDFPILPDVAPSENRDAAITNLFYWCNIIHDVMYAYGFDEPAGNFQANNYGNGGSGADEVRAEAQDGSGLNNANFFTPNDGFNPRMQMFLWTGQQTYLTINSPSAVAGEYVTTGAQFGPEIPATPLTADVVLFDDGTGVASDACEAAVNGAALAGKIALIDRLDCTFVSKIERAQAAGAIAVIMANNVAGAPITMGGTSGAINIPSVMITLEAGNALKAQLAGGQTVNATIQDASTGAEAVDGDFDNGVIVHEYGHGISTRLVGGRLNSTCLANGEQMGEGWSDWYGMMLTMDMTAPNPVYRPIGTYAVSETPDGVGIRPVAYDTSFAVNSYTYADRNREEISVPHGVGFIWATMLWDLTWAFIDTYGFDPDIYNGTGGNNMMMQLVTDALKLTACGPGFVDGRNAILQADQINNAGDNQCLIWEVFARRGLGASATQGLTLTVADGQPAFDLPSSCLATVEADFLADALVSCDGEVGFTDASTGAVNTWTWDFGDGSGSGEQNPVHQYTESGTYTVTLTVSDGSNQDELVRTDYVIVALTELPETEALVTVCSGEQAVLEATSPNTTTWYNAAGQPAGTGATITTGVLTASETWSVADAVIVNETTCESDRAEVVIEVLQADFDAAVSELTVTFTDASTGASSWEWTFGDGNTSDQQNPVHVYAGPGVYDVTLTINGSCSADGSVEAVALGVSSLYEAAGVELLPNPASGEALLRSGKALPAGTRIRLLAMDGSVAAETVLSGFETQVELPVSVLPSGIYTVLAGHDGEVLVRRKLVVVRP